jgi:rubrerythrin
LSPEAKARRGFKMKQTDRISAIEVAITNEEREREFYLNNARRTQNPLGREMFQQIADDELEHMERLKQLRDTWTRDDRWPETVPLTVSERSLQEVLSTVVDKAAGAGSDSDDLEAVRTAIKFEDEASKYYSGLRDMVSDPKERAFFDLMSRIEREHYLSLKETEEFFTDPEGWHQKRERHSLDGG